MRFQQAIYTVLRKTDRTHLTITNEDEEILTSITACLKPFFTITKSLSGEKYIISSLIIPSILYFHLELDPKDCDSEFLAFFKRQLIESVEYYTDSDKYPILKNESLLISSLLNPNYMSFKVGGGEV